MRIKLKLFLELDNCRLIADIENIIYSSKKYSKIQPKHFCSI